MSIKGWILIVALLAPRPAAAESRPNIQVVEVKPGYTLWRLANEYLNDPQRWPELLQYNPQLGSDPTVVLPFSSIQIPARLLKPQLRAAQLTYIESEVYYRPRGKQEWVRVTEKMSLFEDDSLRTGAMSRARIKFPLGSVLNLDSNSVLVIKPQLEGDGSDLQLLRGRMRALHLKLKTDDATITPKSKNTIYEATVADDTRSTKVEVYRGAADVAAGTRTVEVPTGFSVEAAGRMIAGEPKKIVGPSAALASAPTIGSGQGPVAVATNLGKFQIDFQSLTVGTTLAGFRVQASRTKDFTRVVFDKTYEVDEEINIRNASLDSGEYWWRVAPVDLLGATGNYSSPKLKRVD